MQYRRRAIAAVAALAVATTVVIATTQGATARPRPTVSARHHTAPIGTFVADPVAIAPSSPRLLAPHAPATGVTPQALFTWGWITGTVYFSKRETALIAAVASAGSYAAPLIPGWGYLVGSHLATIAAAAGIAVANNRCLKIKIPSLTPGSYTGGYCR